MSTRTLSCMALLAAVSVSLLVTRGHPSPADDHFSGPVAVPSSLPLGSVMAYAGPIYGNINERLMVEGWALCDGSEISRTDYKLLYSILLATYGDGDGWSTFNLPDYRGDFLRGVDDPDGPGGRLPANKDPNDDQRRSAATNEEVGGLIGTIQGFATALPQGDSRNFQTGNESHSHKHPASTTARNQGGPNSFEADGERGMTPRGRVTVGPNDAHHHHTITGGGDDETRPVNTYVNWIMKIGLPETSSEEEPSTNE